MSDGGRAAARRNAQVRTTRPQPSGRYVGWSTGFVILTLIFGLIAGAGGLYGFQWWQKNYNQPAALGYPKDPDYWSTDGSVLLDNTSEAGLGGTTLELSTDKKAAGGINDSPQLAFTAISTPMDITFMRDGKSVNDDVPSDMVTVTLKYDPKLIPKGMTARQVGMVVYDERLEAWVPILNAIADPTTNTVTARAPHFSWFTAIVLDPLQKTIEAAGKTIQSTVTNVMTVADWLWQVTQELTGELINDLTGTPPALNCKSNSKQVTVQTTSTLDKLKGCVEAADSNDKLRLSNNYAFPMLTEELPTGVTLSEQDIWDNGANLPDMIRSMYWANQKRAYISGAENSSLTITPDMQETATVTMELDSDALSFDIGLAVLSLIAPEAEPTKKAVHTTIKTIAKNGAVDKAELDNANAWVAQSYDYADCVAGASHDLDEQPFSGSSTNTAANVAHDCLSSVLGQLDPKGALAELLSSLKTIPATIQSLVYATSAAVLDSLPKQFNGIKMHPPTATVTRTGYTPTQSQEEQPQAAPSPTKPKKAKENWGNYKSLVGSWKAANFTVTIKSDATGNYKMGWGKCNENYDAGTLVNCKASGSISFLPGTPSSAHFGTPKATSLEEDKTAHVLPEISARYDGASAYVSLASDGHSIIFDGGPFDGLDFCDGYMLKYSDDPNSPHWGRCDGTP